MKVVVCGGYRMGTTHAYVIAQHVLASAGIAHGYAGANAETIGEFLARPGTDVIKAHNVRLEPARGLRLILCRRAAADAIGSRLRIGSPLGVAIAELREALLLERAYAGRADVLTLDYERYYGSPREKAAAIAVHLGVRIPERGLDVLAKRLGVDAMKRQADELEAADPQTELRPRHIGPELGRPGAYELPEAARLALENLQSELSQC